MQKKDISVGNKILYAAFLMGLALFLLPSSYGAGPSGWADSPEENGHWDDSPDDALCQGYSGYSRCVRWCFIVQDQHEETEELCCLEDGTSTWDASAACLPRQ